MPRPLKLLLPALIPSWNFFDVIAPSPRIEYALSSSAKSARTWREFRPRPERLSVLAMLMRLVWNPRWNESLFLVSCAERLINEPTAHSEDEIFKRIAADLAGEESIQGSWLAFRLVFLHRDGEEVQREVLFEAQPRRREDIDIR